MLQRDTVIHLVAGGTAGTAGAIVTCPLEVVKTRLQSSSGFHVHNVSLPKIASAEGGSSHVTCKTLLPPHQRRRLTTMAARHTQVLSISHCGVAGGPSTKSMSIYQCIRHIVEREGVRALFKGLGPNLVGVAPSRAIYFCAYSQSKEFLNTCLPPNSAPVHVGSAFCAGFVACSATNPIWLVKTRLQLDHNADGRPMTAKQVVRRVYRLGGLRGFYKGVTASYFGIAETVIHFVIYEAIKAKLSSVRAPSPDDSKSSRDFFEFMVAGAFSKTVASCIAYPHEVARTRLREEGTKYRSFFQTLGVVMAEEGYRGLYRGLWTQLVRQIPNTAIMMATYEAVVYVLTRHYGHQEETQFYDVDEIEDDDLRHKM